MARLQTSADEAGPSSSKQPFTQHYTVVEHLPSGSQSVSHGHPAPTSRSGNAASNIGSGNHDDSDRFAKNSKIMEERATNDLRETLRWVTRMSSGPVDRRILREAARSMKPNAYKDVMTERWVADICAYPACGKGPRKPYNAEQPIYRINLRAKRVFDTSAAMKYCSDECARRSIWYETVCLQQNAFEIPDLSQPVQLLEDTEGSNEDEAVKSDTVTLPADQLRQLQASTADNAAQAAEVPVKIEASALNEQTENFLAQLSIIERHPSRAPIPPSEDYADEINQEDNPTIAQLGVPSSNLASTSTFDIDTLRRSLPEGQPANDGTDAKIIVEERAGLARRIEIDVDPEYRDLLDEGFELYRQMKEAGEFT
ncbi:hypothetical protein P389DRAFT_193952 [Cystobasidium minutum MCA 4210]|uniref:uncharacterized protein n=1 Tax=Cystobasidium minutum MCA 4210 TaxID=1397322 RepID=UPI0034CFD809|eukprot:jgi/Rhomi1/193952/gm1.2166_g